MTDNSDSKRALITGATGFVGSHLARRLVTDGWEAHILVRKTSTLDQIIDFSGKAAIHKHDGSMDNMMTIIKKARPDIVFHLASLFLAEHQPDDIDALIKSNILFGTQLVEAMVKNNAYHLINTGTSWQHYHNEAYNPVCLYAATKEAFETLLKFYTETTALKVINLKLYDTYGPNDRREKLLSLLQKISKNQEPLNMSPGEQFLDLVYIDDVVSAFILASERIKEGMSVNMEDFAVSSGKPIKLKKLVNIYQNITGKTLPIRWGGRLYRSREVMTPWSSGAALPGWQPLVNIETGIRRVTSDHHRPRN